MEATGLAIGAVALISLFKDCVDLFSMITAARRLGKDAAILETKLDVERMLLLRWSDRVGLLQFIKHEASSNGSLNPSSTPLRDVETRKIVLRVLTCIQSLLSEGEALQQSYGLQQFDPSDTTDSEAPAINSSQGASASRLERFLQEFQRLQIGTKNRKSAPRPSRFTETTEKVRWVIMHKDKFNTLISNLSYFNSSLMELAPTASSTLPPLQADLSHVRSIPELDMIIQASADARPAVKAAAIAAKQAILSPLILQRLWFRHHEDRRFNVKEAHYQTLRWALDPPNGYRKWDDLSSWLQGNSSIYWISGKAGSGKSTLMKYLLSQNRMRELLKKWVCSSAITMVSFFFYALGRTEQKSQSGLLRSLLYQLLKQDFSSIDTILPNMWQEACSKHDGDPLELSVPSVAEMKTALFDLCASSGASRKLFFVIDGADEYEGGDLDAVKFITDLGAFPNVKVLVSSRPHSAYVTAFSHKPRLNLQDLTRDDIAAYINDSIASHPYLVTLSEIQPRVVEDLTKELVGKASGVFLWVVLACRSVIEGCNDYCPFSDLQRRVDDLPKEVEELLQHMLDKVKPEWRREAISLLTLVYTNGCNDDFEPIPTLALHLVYEQGLQVTADSTKAIWDRIPDQQRTARCQILEGILRSRCCGLLEVQRPNMAVESHNYCFCNGEYPHDSLQDSEVVFMHRAVYELLSQPRAWRQDFDVFQNMKMDSLAVLSMMWCRVVAMVDNQHSAINGALSRMYHGHRCRMPPETLFRCLSMLQVLCAEVRLDDVWPTVKQYSLHEHWCHRCCDDSSISLALAVEMGFISVVKFFIEDTSSVSNALPRTPNNTPLCHCRSKDFRKPLRNDESSLPCRTVLPTRYPLLYHAVCRPMLRQLYNNSTSPPRYQNTVPNLGMVRYILQLGCSPNDELRSRKQGELEKGTVWTQWIKGDPNISSVLQGSMTWDTLETTKLLLDAKADVERLEASTLSVLLGNLSVYRQSPDYENSEYQKVWERVQKAMGRRTSRAVKLYSNSLGNEMIEAGVGEKSGNKSEKREATNTSTNLIKRRKVIIDLTQD
ncbi:hypothetical protein ACHAQI_004279 [Fusarium lateritium]